MKGYDMISFKTDKIKKEFTSDKVHPRLKKIMTMLSIFCEVEFAKDIVVTELLRTQAEQDRYYGKNPAYIKKPWNSVHQFGRGCDIRTINHFTPTEIKKIVAFLNIITYRKKSKVKTATYHNIGLGNHIHIQVSY